MWARKRYIASLYKFYGRYNHLLKYPLSRFLCDLVICWCVFTYTGFGSWSYSLLYGGCVAKKGEVYSSLAPIRTLGFSRVTVLSSVTFIHGFVMFIDQIFYINGWQRLFRSVYVLVYFGCLVSLIFLTATIPILMYPSINSVLINQEPLVYLVLFPHVYNHWDITPGTLV